MRTRGPGALLLPFAGRRVSAWTQLGAAVLAAGCLWGGGPSDSEVREMAQAELTELLASMYALGSLFSGNAPEADVEIEAFDVAHKERDSSEAGQWNFRLRMQVRIRGLDRLPDVTRMALEATGIEGDAAGEAVLEGIWRLSTKKEHEQWETVAFESEE